MTKNDAADIANTGGLMGGFSTGTWDGALAGANYGRMAASFAVQASPAPRQWLLGSCFSGDTELMARGPWGLGYRRIDAITLDDEVWSRDEDDPSGPLQWKRVEELFNRTGRVFHLHVNGRVIRTTFEHPFYVQAKDWLPASRLQVGDLLLSHDGRWVAVEDLLDTGEYETLYNLRGQKR